MNRISPPALDLDLPRLTGRRVVETLRLSNGVLFSMPITLDVCDIEVRRFNIIPGSRLVLRDFRDENPLAILTGAYTPSIRIVRWIANC